MNFPQESLYFCTVLSLFTFWLGTWLKQKTGWAVLNPILVSILLTIAVLKFLHIEYATYEEGARYISYLLTPTTVCLAIPLYKQLALLRQNLAAVIIGIFSGVIASAGSIFVLCLLFGLDHTYYVTLLPKSITTAIAMGVSEEAGGIVTVTIICIIITGTLGNIIGESIFKWTHLKHPIARGLALGTSAHAVGTAKAMELGEVEGAMSSLAVAVAGLMTVIVVPLVAGLI
jgi:Putative effector of murein hydrolase